MVGFYERLVSGLGPASALREAQLAEIQDRRKQNKAAHPFFWAAFTVTGNPGSSWSSETVRGGP
jgi:CHAT domain-containing protein